MISFSRLQSITVDQTKSILDLICSWGQFLFPEQVLVSLCLEMTLCAVTRPWWPPSVLMLAQSPLIWLPAASDADLDRAKVVTWWSLMSRLVSSELGFCPDFYTFSRFKLTRSRSRQRRPSMTDFCDKIVFLEFCWLDAEVSYPLSRQSPAVTQTLFDIKRS